jgi:catechol 2,3-dioxygenase-like lactoylglutathione lyase family enzyme
MQVRIARHTARLEAVVRFYRDGLGLPELGRFEDHDGWDGVFLDLPDGNAHLEFTSGGGVDAPEPHGESMLVLYLGDERAVEAVRARLGAAPVEPANPYWSRNAVTVLDPDGFPVVLVPAAWS